MRLLDDLVAVVGVVNGEVAVDLQAVGVLAQQIGAEAMKGADHHAVAGNQGLDALPHFARRLVGEGDRQNVAGPDALLQQPGDSASDDARLAAAGRRQNKQRAFHVRHRFLLGGGQIREEILSCLLHAAASMLFLGVESAMIEM